jgi:hypothetical protein
MVVRLPVDLAELTAAMDEPRNGPVRAFFDRQTGAIEHMPRDFEVEGVYDDILAAPQRWIEILPLGAGERRELRRRFLDEVGDPPLRLRLGDALGGTRPLATFAALVRGTPGELDRWLAFRGRALAPLARTWLSAIHVLPIERAG